MTADNYALCPGCESRSQASAIALRKAAEEAYGKVSASEYIRMLEDIASAVDAQAGYTFREDYEVYVAEDGVVRVDYRGGCSKCGLELKFKHEVPIPGLAA
jgi:hypothetical protein